MDLCDESRKILLGPTYRLYKDQVYRIRWNIEPYGVICERWENFAWAPAPELEEVLDEVLDPFGPSIFLKEDQVNAWIQAQFRAR